MDSTKLRILFFPFNLLSHYLRCLTLANEYFDQDKYEIYFIDSFKYKRYVVDYGYQTFTCLQFDAEKVMNDSKKFSFSWLKTETINQIFESQTKVISLLKPIMVIGDMAPTLKMAAEYSNIQYVALMNGYMSKYYSFPRQISKSHKAYFLTKFFPRNIRIHLLKFGERATFHRIHKPFRAIRRRVGLTYIKNFMDEMEGDKNLICDIPELFPQAVLPLNYKILGPLIFKSKKMESNWAKRIDRNKPVICVCMGSSGDWQRLKFLNSEEYKVFNIITGGDSDKVLHAAHILSFDFINLDDVLSISNLMICHGGNGTIYHGLLNGIFMLCLTSHFEQEWNVHALERLGYGKFVNEVREADWFALINNTFKIRLNNVVLSNQGKDLSYFLYPE